MKLPLLHACVLSRLIFGTAPSIVSGHVSGIRKFNHRRFGLGSVPSRGSEKHFLRISHDGYCTPLQVTIIRW